MGRSRSSKNDWRRYIKFENENEKLRKEVSKLRKLIGTMVVDQLEERAHRVENGQAPIIPACEICGNEDIHFLPIKRPDGIFEIKICNSCGNRGQLKKVKDK